MIDYEVIINRYGQEMWNGMTPCTVYTNSLEAPCGKKFKEGERPWCPHSKTDNCPYYKLPPFSYQ